MMSQDKLGLCLSGGGFRAALFHIGTLAALAERELLHKIEVISTVSGGSIIGAYYYLKVKQLLEGKRPGCPNPAPAAYIEIVKEIERDFLEAVQKNIRMRLFYNPYKTARMLLEEEYSRGDRISELLNEYFYNCIALVDGIRLKDIHITPSNIKQHLGEEGVFTLQEYNDKAPCKIPILIINATCLNTGHPWHFTGSWIGEPQRSKLYEREQNTNFVLPQLRFDGFYQDDRKRKVESWQLDAMSKIMLSDAVAASAAVPGIFPPLPLHKLYKNSSGDEIVVELSDGGVFDNQGLDALLDAQCTHIIVSDACGQLEDEKLLPTDLIKVSQRANDVMMERIRGYGFFNLNLRQEGCSRLPKDDQLHKDICFIQNSTFTHLRQLAPNTSALPGLPGPENKCGGVVYRLSGLRTDLDAFSDLEAYTLMYQGYSLAMDKLEHASIGNTPPSIPAEQWRFLNIRKVIKDDLYRLTKHIKVGKKQFFKVFWLSPGKSWAWLLFLVSPVITFVGFWLYANWNNSMHIQIPAFNGKELIVNGVAVLIALLPISAKVREWFKTIPLLRKAKRNPISEASSYIIGMLVMALSMLASIVIFVYLSIFNETFLRVGRLENVTDLHKANQQGE